MSPPVLLALLALLAAAPAPAPAPAPVPAARDCAPAEIAALTAPVSAEASPFLLTCRATLPPGTTVSRRILIQGAEASGAALDCAGGTVGEAGRPTTPRAPTIAIWSRETADGRFSRPRDIVIRRCVVHGAVRIWGMGAGGAMSDLRESSRRRDHTAAAQAAAPTRIRLEDVTLAATGSIPLYVGPGVTGVTVRRARFTGRSVSVAVYLDAESAGNVLADSHFDLRTGRELVAVDGSARNRITGNRFALNRTLLGGRGGIFLYRNCGEDGVIRHQTPSHNLIQDNVFTGAGWLRPRAVAVGAREGNRRYCGDDAGWPFGSSADDGDHATGNIVRDNVVRR